MLVLNFLFPRELEAASPLVLVADVTIPAVSTVEDESEELTASSCFTATSSSLCASEKVGTLLDFSSEIIVLLLLIFVAGPMTCSASDSVMMNFLHLLLCGILQASSAAVALAGDLE